MYAFGAKVDLEVRVRSVDVRGPHHDRPVAETLLRQLRRAAPDDARGRRGEASSGRPRRAPRGLWPPTQCPRRVGLRAEPRRDPIVRPALIARRRCVHSRTTWGGTVCARRRPPPRREVGDAAPAEPVFEVRPAVEEEPEVVHLPLGEDAEAVEGSARVAALMMDGAPPGPDPPPSAPASARSPAAELEAPATASGFGPQEAEDLPERALDKVEPEGILRRPLRQRGAARRRGLSEPCPRPRRVPREPAVAVDRGRPRGERPRGERRRERARRCTTRSPPVPRRTRRTPRSTHARGNAYFGNP